MRIDWKQKLGSRKFWAGLTGYLTAVLAAFNIADSVTAQVVSIVAGVGALSVYMLSEAIVDAARKNNETEGDSK